MWFPCAAVLWSPAAMPATCVAWNDSAGSNGSDAFLYDGDGGGNARCTITFGVADCVWPFGNPAGYTNPLGLKYGLDASTPSSMIPIFIPWPDVSKAAPHS